MYATHVHPKAQKEKGKAWEVADNFMCISVDSL